MSQVYGKIELFDQLFEDDYKMHIYKRNDVSSYKLTFDKLGITDKKKQIITYLKNCLENINFRILV